MSCFNIVVQEFFGFFKPEMNCTFNCINIIHYLMARTLIKVNPDDENLINALNIKNGMIIPLILFVVGVIVALSGYPVAISICCLIIIVRSIFYSLK